MQSVNLISIILFIILNWMEMINFEFNVAFAIHMLLLANIISILYRRVRYKLKYCNSYNVLSTSLYS